MVEPVKNVDFGAEPILIDNKIFFGCTFNNSNLIYSGGDLPSFDTCTFHSVGISFRGAAGNTLAFMRVLYHAGFDTVIQKTFDEIINWNPDPSNISNNRKEERADG